MITGADKITTLVTQALRERYGTNITVSTTEYLDTPSKFPAVSIVPISNILNSRYSTLTHCENSAIETLEINVYSNAESDNAEECRDITALICDVMSANFWIRTSPNTPITNIMDETVARRTSRFKKII